MLTLALSFSRSHIMLKDVQIAQHIFAKAAALFGMAVDV